MFDNSSALGMINKSEEKFKHTYFSTTVYESLNYHILLKWNKIESTK